jgi:hypothetical protein
VRSFPTIGLKVALCAFLFPLISAAQSTDQNFPTAVTTNEIDGTIKVRDIGDARLTSYFYAFDGGQGDIFINVVTKNFSGDIDVFAVEGLRPLTKMVIYADSGENETGRLVYLRKPERLMLRIEGRSPNDDPATFRIKFGGSFVALAEQKTSEMPTIKKPEVDTESGVRVNSVGTIVEVIPKPPPPVKEKPPVAGTASTSKEKKPETEKAKKTEPTPTKPVVIVTEPPTAAAVAEKKPAPSKPTAKHPPAKKAETASARNSTPPTKKATTATAPEVKTVLKKTPKSKTAATAEKTPKEPAKPATAPEKKPSPMANIRLVVQLKDGKVIERPMSEVTKFSVDNGVLTVIASDGSTVKYSILDVAKVTIE